MLWGIEVVRSFYSHSSVEIFRSYVKLGVNFFAPILSEEVENRHQRDLSWILTKNLSRPGSSPVRPGPSPARPDLQIPYRSGNILPLLFPHQRWKIRRYIFVVITFLRVLVLHKAPLSCLFSLCSWHGTIPREPHVFLELNYTTRVGKTTKIYQN